MSWRVVCAACLLVVAACGRVGFDPLTSDDAGGSSDAGEIDGGEADGGEPDAGEPLPPCTPWLGGWVADPPEVVLNVPGAEYESPVPSPDCLTVYFTDNMDILQIRRPSLGAPFGPAEPVTELNTAGREMSFSMSADGLEGFLSRDGSLWRATRTSTSNPFTVIEDTGLNGADAHLSGDGLRLYHVSSSDIAVAERSTPTGAFGPAQVITELSTPGWEHGVYVSRNELFALLGTERTLPTLDVWMSMRASPSEPFSMPVVLPPLVYDGGPDGHPAMCELTCEVFYTGTELPVATIMRTRLGP